MVGIRDVARKAQVSPTTVSRLLNEDPTLKVSEKTRQRVLQAVAQLNYDLKNYRIKQQRKPSIGVISTISRQAEQQDVYYEQLRLGMELEAKKLHLGMNRIYNLSEDPKKWHDLDQLGAIIVIGTVTQTVITQLKAQNRHVIVVDNPDIKGEVDLVYADIETTTREILELFVAKGHQNLAYLGGYRLDLDATGQAQVTSDEKRMRVFENFRKEHAKVHMQAYLGGWTPAEGKRLMQQILTTKPLPSAVLIASDPLAIGAYQALEQTKLKIGQDIVLVSFDDLAQIATLTPSLTSVNVNAKALGQSAVRLALERIDGSRSDYVKLIYPAKIIFRESFVNK